MQGIKIKPLVWFEAELPSRGGGKFTSEGYTIRRIEGLWLLDFAGIGKTKWRWVDLDAAKAAAQADYEARILAALEPAPVAPAEAAKVPEVQALVELAEELITAVWHLMDNSEESGPIENPKITVWKPDFDEVSAILDRIEGLPSGSIEHMSAGELFAANILTALRAIEEGEA